MLIYGRIPLMISAQCIEKNYNRCTKNGARLILQDRKNYRFPVFCDCGNCQNIIYNSVPLSLISKKEEVSLLKPGSVRFSFTDEDAKTVTKRVRGWIMGGHDPEDFEFTRGHFTKGVE